MSKEAASNKAEDIMDVNQAAVERTVTQHSVSRLIHGHTHRPGRHSSENFERVVLGDWNETGWYLYEQGNALELVEFGLEALA
jgi:UDP-2,3-diacylglucosamine hydrolase